jgi:hypothetical protein
MRIAIFGDSWAKQLQQADQLNLTPAWWEILAEKYTVENFGLSGSSTYFAYDKFEKAHSYFDKIIFIASTPGRLCLADDMQLKCNLLGDLRRHQVTHLLDAENTLEFVKKTDPDNKQDITVLEAIVGYYSYVMNPKEQQLINRVYQQMVEFIRPDSLVVESFNALYKISQFESDHWQIDIPSMFRNGYSELRKCHMSAENNAMFANIIDTWIQTGNFNLTVEDYVTPNDPWEKYFILNKGLQPKKT